ncbi:MAG: shikimate kinase [Myxococcales bacterium]|nr:shikimate kinase [Myxococcales bacterium]
MRVALGGPMGVGKSSVARGLALRLGAALHDLDTEIGDIPALFAAGGEPAFRRAEHVTLRKLADADGVLALGGGTLEDADNRALLCEWTVLVLMASPAMLESRLTTAGRPLAGRWRELLEARRETWARYGPPIWTDALTIPGVVDAVRARC